MTNTLFPGIETAGLGMVEGEIESFSTDRIVIVGNFTPGDVIQLREGRRVALLTDEALNDMRDDPPWGCPACDALAGDLEDAQDKIDELKRRVEQRNKKT